MVSLLSDKHYLRIRSQLPSNQVNMFPKVILILSMFGLFQNETFKTSHSETFKTSHSKDKIFSDQLQERHIMPRFNIETFKIKMNKKFDEIIRRFKAQKQNGEHDMEEIQVSQRDLTFNLSLSSTKYEYLQKTERIQPGYNALPQKLSPVQIIEVLHIFRKSHKKNSQDQEFAIQTLITQTLCVFFLDLGIIGVMICSYLSNTRKF